MKKKKQEKPRNKMEILGNYLTYHLTKTDCEIDRGRFFTPKKNQKINR